MSDNPELSTTAPLPLPVGQVPLSDAEKARLLDLNSLDRPLADMERAERDALRLREHPEVPLPPPPPPPLSDAEKVRLHDLGFAGRPLTSGEFAERQALQNQANVAVIEPLAASPPPPASEAVPPEVHMVAIMDGIVAALDRIAAVMPGVGLSLVRVMDGIRASIDKMRPPPAEIVVPPPPPPPIVQAVPTTGFVESVPANYAPPNHV